MKFEDLESQRLIERVEVNSDKVNITLKRAGRDLVTARTNLKIDEEWAYAISYHAMLRAGRALMLYLGYRPKGKDQHKTVGEFCSKVLGEEYRTLINKFHRMRRKRHKFVYELDSPITRSEADHSINNAKKLMDAIFGMIEKDKSNLFAKTGRK